VSLLLCVLGGFGVQVEVMLMADVPIISELVIQEIDYYEGASGWTLRGAVRSTLFHVLYCRDQ